MRRCGGEATLLDDSTQELSEAIFWVPDGKFEYFLDMIEFFPPAATWQKMRDWGLVSRVCESKVLKWKVPEESVNRSLQTFALEFQMCDTVNCRCRKVSPSASSASAQYPVYHLDLLDLHKLGRPTLILAHIFVLNSSEVSELM